jgi:hypothetical protein
MPALPELPAVDPADPPLPALEPDEPALPALDPAAPPSPALEPPVPALEPAAPPAPPVPSPSEQAAAKNGKSAQPVITNRFMRAYLTRTEQTVCHGKATPPTR